MELDAKLAEYVREWFDIPKSPRVKIRVGDAGTVTRSFAPASRDVVIRDVFAVDKTPAGLTSVDFVRRLITPWRPAGCIFSTAGMAPHWMVRVLRWLPCLRYSSRCAWWLMLRCSRAGGGAILLLPHRTVRCRRQAQLRRRLSHERSWVVVCRRSTGIRHKPGSLPACSLH